MRATRPVSNGMKYLTIFSLALVPALALADTLDTLVSFEDNSGLLASLSLWSTIIVAFTTSMMVWVGGRKMHGGVFGTVLTYFSIGMTLIFLGFATEVPWAEKIFSHLYLTLIHGTLYIIGYILMGIAASKLLANTRHVNGSLVKEFE